MIEHPLRTQIRHSPSYRYGCLTHVGQDGDVYRSCRPCLAQPLQLGSSGGRAQGDASLQLGALRVKGLYLKAQS